MQATAKWLTPAEVAQTRKNGVATAQAMVQSALTGENRCELTRRRMYQISELAKSVGLSRATLLYYENQ